MAYRRDKGVHSPYGTRICEECSLLLVGGFSILGIEDRSIRSSCSYPKGIVEAFVLIVIMRRRFVFSLWVIDERN